MQGEDHAERPDDDVTSSNPTQVSAVNDGPFSFVYNSDKFIMKSFLMGHKINRKKKTTGNPGIQCKQEMRNASSLIFVEKGIEFGLEGTRM